ncbi:hypothetical protein [Daejeonella lutea]|uniref:Uncharacterized protein n=1 Tax=Daejeonella lutea TaxID=572036 RepID=A0A1T5DC39_9SPHI|nr:hypothetical protein [Daejeonella lutea]SKB69083.1 hypothetical protein SAMN05661099_2277 [Daejeonella lutea]
MSTNRVSAILNDADKTAVLEALAQVKEKMPFLINLTGKERHRSRKMGAKSVEYVNLNLQGSQSFASLIPPNVDIDEFSKDVTLVNQLMSVRIEVEALLEGIDDTMLAAGSEAMQCADLVYSYLKTGAKTNAGVKGITADIAKRFVRRVKTTEALKA